MAWTEKLLFWLTHDEESGTRYDSHWGHHFAEINTVMAAPGVNGNASLLVRGNNEYLRRTQGIAGFDPMQPWTYITRFYVNTEYRNAGFFGLLTPDGSNHALNISLHPERTQEISLFIRNTDGNNLWQGRTGTIDALTFGEWHTLRVEFDGGPVPPTNEGKTKGRIYIDNVPYIIDGEPLGTSGYIQTPAGGDFIGSGHAVIGYGPSHIRYFDGLFDDSALFQRLLTEDEIAEYEGGITYSQLSRRSILVPLSSAYDLTEFDDPGYTGDAIDLHGSRNLTNVNGATGFSESGVKGASVRRASSQAFTTTDLTDFIINSDDDVTIEIRFRRASTGTSTGVAGIHNIENGNASRDFSALVLFIEGNDTVQVRRGVDGSTYSTFNPGAVIADTEDFHHLIYRWRRVGTTNSAFDETLFLDGQVFHRTYSWIPTSVPQASLWLGRTLADGGYGDLDIDFFRIYKEAITDYDAAYLWNNGSPRSYADLVGGGEDPINLAVEASGQVTTDAQALRQLLMAAEAGGSASAVAALRVLRDLEAAAAGYGEGEAAILVERYASASASASGSAAAILRIARELSGAAGGSGSGSGSLQVVGGLSGSAGGTGGAEAEIRIDRFVQAVASGEGDGSVLALRRLLLAASSGGVAEGEGRLLADAAVLLAATVTGTGSAAAQLRITRQLEGEAEGSSGAQALAALSRLLSGAAGGMTAASASLHKGEIVIPDHGFVTITTSAISTANVSTSAVSTVTVSAR